MREFIIKLLCISLLIAPAWAADSKGKALYRWVDDKGQVHFGDKLPPQDVKQGSERLNGRGTVTKVVPPQKSQEQLEQQDAAIKAHEKQLAYDKYLLQSYGSVADLQATRDDRLNGIDARVRLVQKAVEDAEKSLTELRIRAQGSRPPPAALVTQINALESSLADNLNIQQQLRRDRADTAAKFIADVERFSKLRSGAVSPGD